MRVPTDKALHALVRRENGRARRFYEKHGRRAEVQSAAVPTTSCRPRCTRLATECRSEPTEQPD